LIRVRVLYFAAVRDLVGREEEELALPDGVATVGAFTAWIEAQRPELAGRMGSVRVARNEVFAVSGETLSQGDVLALIPPVAGG
jgi:molybdopterin synthase sulfur carrier subunit